jgi:hypothetical protein
MPDMTDAERLTQAADRLDELADTAELMGDDANSIEMRGQASRMRMGAMDLIPPVPPEANEPRNSAR